MVDRDSLFHVTVSAMGLQPAGKFSAIFITHVLYMKCKRTAACKMGTFKYMYMHAYMYNVHFNDCVPSTSHKHHLCACMYVVRYWSFVLVHDEHVVYQARLGAVTGTTNMY